MSSFGRGRAPLSAVNSGFWLPKGLPNREDGEPNRIVRFPFQRPAEFQDRRKRVRTGRCSAWFSKPQSRHVRRRLPAQSLAWPAFSPKPLQSASRCNSPASSAQVIRPPPISPKAPSLNLARRAKFSSPAPPRSSSPTFSACATPTARSISRPQLSQSNIIRARRSSPPAFLEKCPTGS